MYSALVGHHGIAPSEYWKMAPAECWLVIEAKMPERRFGNMSGDQFDELYQRRRELEAQGVNLL